VKKMMKTLKNLSLDTKTLDNLESADAIPILVKQLDINNIFNEQQQPIQQQQQTTMTIINQALNTLFCLCTCNKKRQEIAAMSGIVGYLKNIINAESPLEHIALSLLCQLAHTSKNARKELWKNSCISYYIDLFGSKNGKWKVTILESLAVWMQEEMKQVQVEMLRDENFRKFVKIFEEMTSATFVKLTEQVQRLLNCVELNDALGGSPFLNTLIKALIEYGIQVEQKQQSINLRGRPLQPDPVITLNLLKIVQMVYKSSNNPKRISGQKNLYSAVKYLVSSNSVIIAETAKGLLRAFDENLKI